MPIRPELRKFYGPDWQAAREPMLHKVHGRCQYCDKPNLQMVRTKTGHGRMFWRPLKGSMLWRNEWGWPLTIEELRIANELHPRTIRVVLTRAHLNRVPGDDRPENIAVLCQWCHLRYDRPVNLQHAKVTRMVHKDAERPLLQLLEAS